MTAVLFLPNISATVVFSRQNMREGKPHIVPLRALASESELERGDDEQLMTLAVAGNQAAFAVLVRRYLPRVTKFCARFVGQLFAAEELAQETFLEVWMRRERYRSQGKLVVFLFMVARHRCLNRVRNDGRRRQREVAAVDDLAGGRSVQLDVLLEEERRRQVQEALLSLSVKLREAVLLRFDQGLDYSDVARILGCSESTTRSRVRLAMLALRAAIEEGGTP